MSGAEKADIDTRAASALSNAGQDDYKWTEANFGSLYDEFRGDASTIKNRTQTGFRERIADHEATLAGAASGNEAAQRRSMSRAGLRAPTGDVAQSLERDTAFGNAETTATDLNTARRGFRDFSIAKNKVGASIGSAIRKMGYDSLMSASEMEANRNSQNASLVRGGLAGGLAGGLSGVIAGEALGAPGMVLGGLSGAYSGYN